MASPRYTLTRDLPYPPQTLFDVVMNIEAYPLFLPGCRGAQIRAQAECYLEADLTLGYGALAGTYTSHVHFCAPREGAPGTIRITSPSPTFRELQGLWAFTPLEEGCRVAFTLDVALQNPFLDRLVRPLIADGTARILSAFETRVRNGAGETALLRADPSPLQPPS